MKTDDIELLKKIRRNPPEVSTKQIYPNNYVWANGLLINMEYGRGLHI